MNKEKNTIDYDEYITDSLKNDPNLTDEYLKAAIEDFEIEGDLKTFLISLQTIAKVKKGGITELSRKTGLNRQQLYRMFANGNPTLKTLQLILKHLGFRLSIKPVEV